MLKTLLAEVKEFKKDSFLTPLFMLLEVAMEMVIPLLMASIIDEGVNAGDMNHIYTVGFYMVIAAAVGLFAGVMGGKYGASASTCFARNLRRAMFARIQTYSFENIDKFSTAGLVTRLTTDVTNLQNAYQMILRMGTRAPASMIVAMFMSFYISPRLASIYLVAVVILGAVLFGIAIGVRKIFDVVFQKYDDLNASVQENISGIRVVKAYVREAYEKMKFQKASGNLFKMFVKAEKILTFNGPAMMITVYSCMLLIIWLGANMIVGSTLTTGELVSLLSYCMNILMSLMMLSMAFVMITMSIASAERITEVLNEETAIKNPEHPVMEVPDGSIDFDHVSFSYEKGAEEFVLQDIDLHIRSGETIGIIGGTGSAKSTLVNLISRLYDVTEGEVKVGGRDVRELDYEDLLDHISLVFQKTFLTRGSVLENIRMNSGATLEQVREAARLAQIDEFIQSLPQGYETKVGTFGSRFSGGERQRIAIARAILKNAPILILDEATSAADPENQVEIDRAIENLCRGKTVVIVAHRLGAIKLCDKVAVVENNTITCCGTHEEVLEKNEYYRRAWADYRAARAIAYSVEGGVQHA